MLTFPSLQRPDAGYSHIEKGPVPQTSSLTCPMLLPISLCNSLVLKGKRSTLTHGLSVVLVVVPVVVVAVPVVLVVLVVVVVVVAVAEGVGSWESLREPPKFLNADVERASPLFSHHSSELRPMRLS